ncbi:uncharacterized protein LOC135824300 [Sycon ciliatum]|uniref:uncharacterized protein LOC135824300 n=1 Tax=Sycon ciliatum TaxID=27933 RepID=UPI0031F660F7
MKKPALYGDSYWCYKHRIAILLLAAVDARGIFTYVNVGNPGSVGDAAAYINSRLFDNLTTRQWLTVPEKTIGNNRVLPYLVGDAAFALSSSLMKCFSNPVTPQEKTFNFRLIRTRRVVEQAFGRLKGRFRILVKNNYSDPDFVSDVTLVCCALHNVCERCQCPFESSWVINPIHYQAPPGQDNAGADGEGLALRNILANHIHAHHPVQ